MMLNSQHRPHWLPDDAVSKCVACEKAFTMLHRKHHCRKCGMIFCAPCVVRQTLLAEFDYTKPVRVCHKCYDLVTKPAAAAKKPPSLIYEAIPELNTVPADLRDNVWFFPNINRQSAEKILLAKAKNNEFIVRPSSNTDNSYVLSCLRNKELCHYLMTVKKDNDSGVTRYVVDSSKHKNLVFDSALAAATALGLTPMVCDDDTDDENDTDNDHRHDTTAPGQDEQQATTKHHQHAAGDDDDGDATVVVSPRTRKRQIEHCNNTASTATANITTHHVKQHNNDTKRHDAPPPAATAKPNQFAVDALIEMGFDRIKVERALKQSGDSIEKATELLLGEKPS